MNSEQLHAVINPTLAVIQSLTGVTPKAGRITFVPELPYADVICAGVNFQGAAEGFYYLMTDRETAYEIANKMSFDPIADQDDPEVISAILELVNMIAGNCVGTLGKIGYETTITPPVLLPSLPQLPHGAQCALVPLDLEPGKVKVALMLSGRYD